MKYLVVLLTFVCIVNNTLGVCKKGEDEKVCWVVRCGSYVETCDPGYHLVVRDPQQCICCNYCEKNKINTTECGPDQEPSACHAADCKPIDSCMCGQHLVKADYSKCICCDRCENDE